MELFRLIPAEEVDELETLHQRPLLPRRPVDPGTAGYWWYTTSSPRRREPSDLQVQSERVLGILLPPTLVEGLCDHLDRSPFSL